MLHVQNEAEDKSHILSFSGYHVRFTRGSEMRRHTDIDPYCQRMMNYDRKEEGETKKKEEAVWQPSIYIADSAYFEYFSWEWRSTGLSPEILFKKKKRNYISSKSFYQPDLICFYRVLECRRSRWMPEFKEDCMPFVAE
ncbi:MAG: hypothetical protein JSC161_000407 [Candidatus Tokpelaia sp. JSC161]|nr:MAG: hypothetical protein JSC161_000407 [Candidatus Tokpelaia sp. JSC161]